MVSADRPVVQHHVARRAPAYVQVPGRVLPVGLENGGEGELEAGVEEGLGHVVLRNDEEGDVGRLRATASVCV